MVISETNQPINLTVVATTPEQLKDKMRKNSITKHIKIAQVKSRTHSEENNGKTKDRD